MTICAVELTWFQILSLNFRIFLSSTLCLFIISNFDTRLTCLFSILSLIMKCFFSALISVCSFLYLFFILTFLFSGYLKSTCAFRGTITLWCICRTYNGLILALNALLRMIWWINVLRIVTRYLKKRINDTFFFLQIAPSFISLNSTYWPCLVW